MLELNGGEQRLRMVAVLELTKVALKAAAFPQLEDQILAHRVYLDLKMVTWGEERLPPPTALAQ